MTNLDWALMTASKIPKLIEEDDDTSRYLVGQYLNEIREIMGRTFLSDLLKLTSNYGLSDYKRQKLQREAKENDQ